MDNSNEAESGRGHRTQITIAASCARVFGAFSNPEQLARWWGPDGFGNTIHAFDFRPGGQWRYTMHGPDGKDYANECRFVEIIPGSKIVIEHFSGHHFILTITYSENGAFTSVGWHQLFDSKAHFDEIAQFVIPANEQNLKRLADEVLRGGV